MSFNKPPRAGIILGYSHEAAMVTDTVRVPPVRNVKHQIRVARPFIYSWVDGHDKSHERRFDIGSHEIDGDMMMNPWIHRDFADGRISHINGTPVYEPINLPVTDHRPAARKAMEQMTRIGRNKVDEPQKVTINIEVKAPTSEQGSLNLVGAINVVEHGHKVF